MQHLSAAQAAGNWFVGLDLRDRAGFPAPGVVDQQFGIDANALIEKANEKERQSEDLDRAISEKRSRLNKEKGSELLNAAVGWATGKSKALKNEIEDLRCEIIL